MSGVCFVYLLARHRLCYIEAKPKGPVLVTPKLKRLLPQRYGALPFPNFVSGRLGSLQCLGRGAPTREGGGMASTM